MKRPSFLSNGGGCIKIRDGFRFCAQGIANAAGSPWTFLVALIAILGWALSGPLFHFSNTWQLVINTATTIITFLMVFLIQNTQNRDTKAVHLKLDELLRGVQGARSTLISLENLSDEELENLQREFEKLRGRLLKRERRTLPGPSEDQSAQAPAEATCAPAR